MRHNKVVHNSKLRRDIITISAVAYIATVALCCFLTGCSSTQVSGQEYVDYYYVGHQAQPPAGVVRYCWEEPLVEYESQGPGVREEGRWYYPSAVVVRQVRSGRWRPCEVRPDESKGETKNER